MVSSHQREESIWLDTGSKSTIWTSPLSTQVHSRVRSLCAACQYIVAYCGTRETPIEDSVALTRFSRFHPIWFSLVSVDVELCAWKTSVNLQNWLDVLCTFRPTVGFKNCTSIEASWEQHSRISNWEYVVVQNTFLMQRILPKRFDTL